MVGRILPKSGLIAILVVVSVFVSVFVIVIVITFLFFFSFLILLVLLLIHRGCLALPKEGRKEAFSTCGIAITINNDVLHTENFSSSIHHLLSAHRVCSDTDVKNDKDREARGDIIMGR